MLQYWTLKGNEILRFCVGMKIYKSSKTTLLKGIKLIIYIYIYICVCVCVCVCVYVCVFVYIYIYIYIYILCFCHLNNHPCILWTILYPSPDDGYYNRNVNVDFTSWYIHLFGLYFFLLPSYIYIYIYTYIIFPFLVQSEKKVNIFKWTGLQRDLLLKFFILLLQVFLVSYHYLQGVIMLAGGVFLDLYCGDSFDRIVALF